MTEDEFKSKDTTSGEDYYYTDIGEANLRISQLGKELEYASKLMDSMATKAVNSPELEGRTVELLQKENTDLRVEHEHMRKAYDTMVERGVNPPICYLDTEETRKRINGLHKFIASFEHIFWNFYWKSDD
ncbi:MAG: hypothetical protein JKY23_06625 [Nitrospinaceae bacterium]|nr:hypothetical protein [Nitrospinaceae bacterium]